MACAPILGLCGLSVPDIKLPDPTEIAKTVMDLCKTIFQAIPEKEEEIRREMREAGSEGFTVPGTSTVLVQGKASKKDIKVAAVIMAASGEARQVIKDGSWALVEPNLSEQIPGGTPDFIKNKALDFTRKKHDEMVDKAIDKALEKVTMGGGEGGADEGKDGDEKGGKGAGGIDEKTETGSPGSSSPNSPSAPKADITLDFTEMRGFLASCCDEEDVDYIMQMLAQSRVKLRDLPLLSQDEMINIAHVPLGPAKRLNVALKKYREVSDEDSDYE